MKGFKNTGGGPRSGHHFPKSAGFTDSSGKVQHVNGYVRRVPAAPRPKGK